MSVQPLIQAPNGRPAITESQDHETDFNFYSETIEKVKSISGMVFCFIGVIALLALISTPLVICIAPSCLLSKAVAPFFITAVLGIVSMPIGLLLIKQGQKDFKKFDRGNLAELTHIAFGTERNSSSQYVKHFTWRQIVKHYHLYLSKGERNFDQLRARVHREMEESNRPIEYAIIIYESFKFSERQGPLSRDELRAGQLIQEAFYNRIRRMNIQEFVSCFTSGNSFDERLVNRLHQCELISSQLAEILFQGLRVQHQLLTRTAENEQEFFLQADAARKLLQVMSQEGNASGENLGLAIEEELENLRQIRDQKLIALRQEAEIEFEKINQDLVAHF